MKSLKKNNKGFTLIELLAVIVILGVLMIIAVPMVTQYITSAKRGAFLSTAKAYVSSARYAYLNEDYTCQGASINTGAGGAVVIPFNQIKVDKANGMSSFNKKMEEKSYVIIQTTSSGEYVYYVRMVDEGNNGFNTPIDEDKLEKKDVKINNAASNGYSNVTAMPTSGDVAVTTEKLVTTSGKITIAGSCTLNSVQ